MISLWLETCGESLEPRAPLPGDRDVDIAVVGAGYTGLWTAYYLSVLDPSLRIAVLEKEIAGFGASGRNGGWCSSFFPTACGADMRRALEASVDEVGRWGTAEGIDAHYRKGGALSLARTARQVEHLRSQPHAQWLSADEMSGRLRAMGALGASYDAECAALHPGRLVRGLARVVQSRGVEVYEQTAVARIAAGRVETSHGLVRPDVVVRALEGWTPTLPQFARTLAPLYSLVIATEPLPDAVWDEIGWHGHETVTDGRQLLVYAQRTADDRIVFGGRGAPYHFGSRIRSAFDREPAVFADLRSSMVELWPALRDAVVTHRWGGPLGVPRDFHPSVGLDRSTGLAWGGGYVGDGVAASNLAGRTLADLILGRDTELTHLPWVGHRSPPWEPEPLRWLGINAVRMLAASIDRTEVRGRPARVRSAVVSRLTGEASAR